MLHVFVLQIGASFAQTNVSLWCVNVKVSSRMRHF